MTTPARAEFIRTPLFIDGAVRTTERTILVPDPARPAQHVGEAAAATESDVADAISAAARAFPAWSALTPAERAELIGAAVAVTDEQIAEDARVLSRENGKILVESTRDVSMLQRRTLQTLPFTPEVDAVRTLEATDAVPTVTEIGYQPLGVVTIIVPFNWPVGILSNALPHALLAGNTVVVKPPPSAPLATTRVVQRMAERLPAGVVNLVTGHDEAMTGLIQNEAVAKVCFTGSVGGGKRIMTMAAQTLTRVTLELGGNDAALILDDAPLDEAAADRLFHAVFSTAGQVCMNAKRLLVHRSRLDEVVHALTTRLQRAVLGDGTDPATTLGPVHTARQRAFVAELIADARDRGSDVREFGELPTAPGLADGHFVRPTVVVDPPRAARVVVEEPFGPVVPVLPFDTDDEAVALANDNWAGLSGSVWTADLTRARALADRLVCGYVWLNDHGAPRLDLRAPFGGMKQSGMGREQGLEGIRAFQDTRAVSVTPDFAPS